MLQNLIWLDDSVLRGHTLGMQSTSPIQLLAQNSLSSFLSLPDLATTLHNLLHYSMLEEETDSLTSAPLHVKQALYGPSSCTPQQNSGICINKKAHNEAWTKIATF